jgi:NAD(P)-dependent dehydrogenase (short-subunit alcohol dehydrogenase family)
MRTLAIELGPHGIRVNAVCPGPVEGARIDGVIEREANVRGITPAELREEYLRRSSLRTFIRAEDIARSIVFLASPDGERISGQDIVVDGHMTHH